MERNPHEDRRRIVRLLTALVALASVLVVGLGVAAVVAWRAYAGARSALRLAGGDEGGPARELLAEIAHKQQAVSEELAAMAKDSSRQIAQFERRAELLRQQGREGGGPIASAARAVEMTQLMADEMLLQLKMMAALNAAMEKTSRPLPAQHELLQGRTPGPAARRAAR